MIHNKQVATQADVDKGIAVFFVPDNRSKVFDLGQSLPAAATAARPIEVGEGESIPPGTPLTVVQAEIVDGKDVLIGFVYDDGQKGVCTLEEVNLSTG